MDKANIIKALEHCGHVDSSAHGISSCKGCPYEGMELCDQKMCNDAIALLKANSEAPKATRYSVAGIYTKKGSMLPYFVGKSDHMNSMQISKAAVEYGREREIQLIVLTRHEKGKTFCKIKCPVNPLPIKGEFQVPTFSALHRWLTSEGWQLKQKICPRLFE